MDSEYFDVFDKLFASCKGVSKVEVDCRKMECSLRLKIMLVMSRRNDAFVKTH